MPRLTAKYPLIRYLSADRFTLGTCQDSLVAIAVISIAVISMALIQFAMSFESNVNQWQPAGMSDHSSVLVMSRTELSKMIDALDDEQVKKICRRLSISFDDSPTMTRSELVTSLIKFLQTRERFE